MGHCVVESCSRRRSEGPARHSPGGRWVWEKPLPLRSDLRARGLRGAEDDAPSCGADSVGGPRRRRRRNMESKAGPSCRLVFCLLISAAVLRPGEQGPPGSPRPTWAGGNFLRSGPGPRTSGAVRAGVWGEVRGRRCRHRAGPGFSHLCRTCGPGRLAQVWAGTGGHWVNLQELWVLPGLGLQGPAGRIRLDLSPSPCGSRLGGEPVPSDNSFSLRISKSTSLRSGQFSFRLARWQ